MENKSYKALLVEEFDGKFVSSVKTFTTDQLPEGEVLIRVHYSSVNYKDALSASGNKGVTKNYPHTPGIDAAGVVEYSESSDFKVGDEVIVTGYDLGMNTAGGFGEYIRVSAAWVVRCPSNLSLKEAMIIGTAGFTSAISVSNLVAKVKPEDGKIIVSGATGGVGSVALMLLHKLGYQTVAVSGKETEHEFLKSLGVSEIIPRSEFQIEDKRPILSAQYAGGIDTVGGSILVNMLKAVQPLGIVTTCGSVSSTKLEMTVFPFILRGITLTGISAQNYPMPLRQELWNKLSSTWKLNKLQEVYTEISLNELSDTLSLILQGKLRGRTIVNMQ